MNVSARFLAVTALLSACGGSAPRPAPAPTAPDRETAAFVATIGRDTVSAERFTLEGNRLTGETFTRSPRTVSRRYDALLRPDGTIQRLEVTSRTLTAPPATPVTVTTLEFAGDSASVRIVRGDSVVTQRVPAAPGAIPFVGGSYALYETTLRYLRQTGRSGGEFGLIVPGAQIIQYRLELQGDSGYLSNIAGRSRIAADAEGRLTWLDGSESTQKIILHRLADADVAAMATAFAQQEATGRGLGVLSPRDSVVADVGAARVVIDYGRPARRGRQVMGEIIPWDEVWRTGANAATGLRTSRDLMIGGAHVPAGAYTLWTLPTRAGWKLIINKQTGQWGTEYSQAQDLARVDMQVGRTSTPAELFTIALQPGASAGTLRMTWGELELSVPVVVH